MDNFWFLEHFLIFLSKSEYYPYGFLPVSSGGIFYPAESRDNESPMFAASLNVQRSVTDIVNVLQLIMNVGHCFAVDGWSAKGMSGRGTTRTQTVCGA